jgi:transcription-repair coupling factor (superfamily II helicase)
LSKVGGRTEIESLKVELADRFGPLPVEVERLLDAATLRVLGRALGVERVIVRDRTARITFREGVVPKMAVLEGPLRQRQVYMEVRRVHPLSLQLEQAGADPILETVMVALSALASARSEAA